MSTQINSRSATGRPADLRHLVSIEDLAEHLGVSVRHVRRLVSERRIPFHKWGRLLRFDIDEVNTWLDATLIEPHDEGRIS
jgi:excisionase family DNA binding protein